MPRELVASSGGPLPEDTSQGVHPSNMEVSRCGQYGGEGPVERGCCLWRGDGPLEG